MQLPPFEFVVCKVQPDVWYAWPWEFAYFVECGQSEGDAIANSKALLDQELDRREAIDAQFKFRPDQCPPPLKRIHERVQQDKTRRKLPHATRSYADWLDAYPIEPPVKSFALDASDSEIADQLRDWANLVCAGRFDEASRMIPDASSILPVCDFPKPQVKLSSDMLRCMLDEAFVELPFDRIDVSGPSITRIERAPTTREIGQRLVCGLGEILLVASYSIALPKTDHVLEMGVHGFSSAFGLSPTLRTLEIKSADE